GDGGRDGGAGAGAADVDGVAVAGACDDRGGGGDPGGDAVPAGGGGVVPLRAGGRGAAEAQRGAHGGGDRGGGGVRDVPPGAARYWGDQLAVDAVPDGGGVVLRDAVHIAGVRDRGGDARGV